MDFWNLAQTVMYVNLLSSVQPGTPHPHVGRAYSRAMWREPHLACPVAFSAGSQVVVAPSRHVPRHLGTMRNFFRCCRRPVPTVASQYRTRIFVFGASIAPNRHARPSPAPVTTTLLYNVFLLVPGKLGILEVVVAFDFVGVPLQPRKILAAATAIDKCDRLCEITTRMERSTWRVGIDHAQFNTRYFKSSYTQCTIDRHAHYHTWLYAGERFYRRHSGFLCLLLRLPRVCVEFGEPVSTKHPPPLCTPPPPYRSTLGASWVSRSRWL